MQQYNDKLQNQKGGMAKGIDDRKRRKHPVTRGLQKRSEEETREPQGDSGKRPRVQNVGLEIFTRKLMITFDLYITESFVRFQHLARTGVRMICDIFQQSFYIIYSCSYQEEVVALVQKFTVGIHCLAQQCSEVRCPAHHLQQQRPFLIMGQGSNTSTQALRPHHYYLQHTHTSVLSLSLFWMKKPEKNVYLMIQKDLKKSRKVQNI